MDTCRLIKLYNSDTVADIGAYIGEFSRWCALNDVNNIRSFKATPRTFNILNRNTIKPMHPYNFAVVSDDYNKKRINICCSPGIGVTNSIVKTNKKGDILSVKTIKYSKAIKGCTVVKIDVEGAEYSYDIINNIDNLRAIVLEFHPYKNDWMIRAKNIMDGIASAGFRALKIPLFKNGWDFIGAWER